MEYPFMKQCQFYEEIDSTNSAAKALARTGAPEGFVVYADRQTAGRGRLGKSFHSPKGGLYCSVILRPKLRACDMMALTAAIAVAVHRALLRFGICTQMKWVNDLFLGGRKICGILCEGQFSGDMPEFVIAGIGINLTPDPSLPTELRPIVTDILTETGVFIPREALLDAVLSCLNDVLIELPKRSFLEEYTRNSATIGHIVRVSQGEREFVAQAIGYAEDAGLIIRHADGSEEVLRSGTAVPL